MLQFALRWQWCFFCCLTKKEATFPNGSKDGLKYLTKNLITPDRLMKTFGRGKYVVTISFLIDKQEKFRICI